MHTYLSDSYLEVKIATRFSSSSDNLSLVTRSIIVAKTTERAQASSSLQLGLCLIMAKMIPLMFLELL